MTFAAVFDGRDLTADAYDDVVRHGGAAVWDQPARSHHVCLETDGGFTVVDVWESEDAFARFGQDVIGPATAEAGIELPPPKIHRIHNLHRGPATANVATVQAMYGLWSGRRRSHP